MSDKLELTNRIIALVRTLRSLFEDRYTEMVKGESVFQFNFSTQITDLSWVNTNLPVLSENILSIPALLKLEINIDKCFKEEFRVRGSTSKLELEWSNPDPSKEVDYGSLPPNAIDTYDELWSKLKGSSSIFLFSNIYALLEKLERQGAIIVLKLNLSIYKNTINDTFVINGNLYQNIVCFLFPESFLSNLKSSSLETFENDFYKHGKRTIIPVFGFSGYLKGDFLSICGYDYINNISRDIIEPLSNEVLQKANKSINLRQYHSSGIFPAKNLTPDVFSILIDKNDGNLKNEISSQLNSFRALLSVLFLANYSNAASDGYLAEYLGHGKVTLTIKRDKLLENEPYLDDVYQLYVYAFDSFSVDKLELARQFVSLSVDSIASLCRRATRIRDATKAAYDNVLLGKVSDYFDSRQKIQEIIRTSIDETSTSIRNLSQDVSKDLYTIAGVIAIAVAGVILKPDFELRKAVMVVSLIIAAYMFLVILYHLGTLRQAYNVQMAQRSAYIRSFEEVLGSEEIDKFLGNEQLENINTLFNNTLDNAYLIYSLILAVTLIVAFLMI